jgi:hypothetical protein
LKQLVETSKIPLNFLLRFLLDAIKLHPNVIGIHISIFLHDQRPQLVPISWRWLQPLEPLFGSAPQIQLSDLE